MIGTSIAHYKITDKLGQGGMGEVYRATDTKLNRDVALKVLPEAFASDQQRMARFAREAQVLASLNHPNIASIYGLEEADGKQALVLELVEGETLAERIKKEAIPLEESLKIALQMAEALEAAHEKGVIHRDLKPANVKITPEGTVKVLDFGLAKALEDESPPEDIHDSPTISQLATKAGIILGTAAYMSPEQAKGKPTDKRTDIWAFGAVLYEMLTGQRTFEGEDASEILASVIKVDIDWSKLPKNIPQVMNRWLRRCLQADLKQRLQDMGDFRLEIRDYLADPSAFEIDAATTRELSEKRQIVPWLLAAVVATTWLLTSFLTRESISQQVLKTELTVVGLESSRPKPPLISPDGRKVLYTSQGKLWVRDLTQSMAKQVFQSAPGGEGVYYPCWSPDSRSLASVSGDRILRTDLETGREFVLCPRPNDLLGSGGSAWLPDDRILLVGGSAGVLEVSAQGGDPRVLLELGEDENDFHEISLLPKSRGFLLTVHRAGQGADSIAVFDGETRKWVLQSKGELFASPAYSPSGHILYVRQTSNPGVWALPFSLETLEATGDPFLVHPEPAIPSVSGNGTLLLAPFREVQSRLVWVDRAGEILGTVGDVRSLVPTFKLSGDNRKLAVAGLSEGNSDVWVEDLVRGTQTPLATEVEAERPGSWLSDDEPLIWVISQGEIRSQPLTTRPPKLPPTLGGNPSVSKDGRYVFFERRSDETLLDIWYVDLTESLEPTVFVQTTANEGSPSVSPDGRFVAYQSDTSGQGEIYIQDFLKGGQQWQVSSGGGSLPRWRSDGRALFFVQGHELASVEVKSEPGLALGERVALFGANLNNLLANITYEVAADGRFLIPQLVFEGVDIPRILFVQNWFEEFRAK